MTSPAVSGAMATWTQTPSFPLLLSGGPVVDFDRTALWVSVIFIVLIVAMKPLLFDPLLRLFEERKARTRGAKEEARLLEHEAQELLVQYDERIRAAERVATEECNKIRGETAHLEARVLEEGRLRAQQIIDAGRADIQAESEKIQRDLATRSGAIARDLARQVLGRELS